MSPSIAFAILIFATTPASAQSDFARPLKPFLERYCFDCHDSDGAKGGLNIEKLEANLSDPGTMARWIRI